MIMVFATTATHQTLLAKHDTLPNNLNKALRSLDAKSIQVLQYSMAGG
jgi:hypothetical protein